MCNNSSIPIPFQPFDEDLPFHYYEGHHLPHIRQNGCTYFVTFRLADSVPRGRLNQWKQERAKWLIARSVDVRDSDWRAKFNKLSFNEKRIFERSFASRLFESLDKGCGACYLRRPEILKKMTDAITYFDQVRFYLGDFVIMPNHVHALMTPINGFELEDVLHSIKSWASNQINRIVGRSGQLWMKDTYDRLTRDGDELIRTQDYIRFNPIKAGLALGEYATGTAAYSHKY